MRILHTSDWHLGRTFHGCDLGAEQEAVLSHLAGLVGEHAVDVVVVAGDVFDRALPNAETVRLYDRVLTSLRAAGARVVVSSGNHDSPARLGALAGFAAAGGLHLHTEVAACAVPTVIAGADGHDVAFYGLPYLEPDTARRALGAPAGSGHAGVLGAALDAVRADLATRAVGTRSVVLAHALVVPWQAPQEMAAESSVEVCDSERSLAVGGVQTAPSALFDGVDYVALGHLHGCQQPDVDRPWLRYSGSPLAYSFSEARQRKSVLLVDLGPDGLCAVQRIVLPVPRALATLTGRIEELLVDPAHARHASDWLQVVLTDDVRPQDPMRRLQTRFPHAVSVQWQPACAPVPDSLSPATRRPGRDDLATAADFVVWVRNSVPSDTERELLGRALGAAQVREAVG
ncbi:MAG: exonuclease SbcCD subunit D C-terminal domain-containing protein [Geodermatophilaceae bacterium]|nr:exonuclease SbcCD subunit D C-terminal domain-containing protein [Geodermatophilaceae bacterium]